MEAKGLIPILNVSDFQASVAWFEKLGWRKLWDWGNPPAFGCVRSGHCEIFLCKDGQGGRGRSAHRETYPDDTREGGVWISIFVEDVDSAHRHCVEQGLDITWPPTNMEWGVREMHVRHPDGHVLRIGSHVKAEDCPLGGEWSPEHS